MAQYSLITILVVCSELPCNVAVKIHLERKRAHVCCSKSKEGHIVRTLKLSFDLFYVEKNDSAWTRPYK